MRPCGQAEILDHLHQDVLLENRVFEILSEESKAVGEHALAQGFQIFLELGLALGLT